MLSVVAVATGVLQVSNLGPMLGIGHPAIWIIAVLFAIALGAAVGMFNGVLIAYGQIPSFIVTLGGRGSLALGSDGWVERPAHRVQVVDTTGAGDTYAGVLAAGLDAGLPLAGAMQRASVAAALACTRTGAQPSMPWAAEIAAGLQSP